MIDLTPATQRVAAVARAVRDDQLDGPTPNPGMDVQAVLQHVLGSAVAFRDAAAKVDGPTTRTPPAPVSDPLPEGWRDLLGTRLDELAAAWRDPAAWEGMTAAGGIDLPGEVCGLVALDELVLHGWDLAVATGQDYAVSDADAEAVLPVVTPEDGAPADGSGRDGLFGRVVDVRDDAPLFERVLGLSGRDPRWTIPG